MDLMSLGFVGLITLGTVNVVTFFKPTLDSKMKFTLSLAVAFGLTFVPADIGNVILNHAKEALAIALGFSGVYKLATKAGGN